MYLLLIPTEKVNTLLMLFFQKIPAFLIPIVLCIAIVSEIYLCLLNTFFELAFFRLTVILTS